jgi:hypothetical protein
MHWISCCPHVDQTLPKLPVPHKNTDRAWSKSNTAVLYRQLLQLISLAGLSRRSHQAPKLADEGIHRTKAGGWWKPNVVGTGIGRLITQINTQPYVITLFTVGSLRHLIYVMPRERGFLSPSGDFHRKLLRVVFVFVSRLITKTEIELWSVQECLCNHRRVLRFTPTNKFWYSFRSPGIQCQINW